MMPKFVFGLLMYTFGVITGVCGGVALATKNDSLAQVLLSLGSLMACLVTGFLCTGKTRIVE